MTMLKGSVPAPVTPAQSAGFFSPGGGMRVLRLPAVKQMTGLGKTKIYELQAAGDFPMRVQLTTHCVGWVEQEVQAWLSRRIVGGRVLQTD